MERVVVEAVLAARAVERAVVLRRARSNARSHSQETQTHTPRSSAGSRAGSKPQHDHSSRMRPLTCTCRCPSTTRARLVSSVVAVPPDQQRLHGRQRAA